MHSRDTTLFFTNQSGMSGLALGSIDAWIPHWAPTRGAVWVGPLRHAVYIYNLFTDRLAGVQSAFLAVIQRLPSRTPLDSAL